MSPRTRSSRHALLALVPALAIPVAAQAQCPAPEAVSASIQQVFKRPGIEVTKVSPAQLKGLCEVQVSFQGRPNVLYTDATGAYFITGHLIDAKGGTDLTEETISALTKISPEELKKVDALVAMTVGTKGVPVYFVTDPQ